MSIISLISEGYETSINYAAFSENVAGNYALIIYYTHRAAVEGTDPHIALA